MTTARKSKAWERGYAETSMQLTVALLKQKILWQNFPLTPQVIYIRGINVFIACEHSPSTRHA